MKKRECPSCAMHVPASSKVCLVCGYEFSSTHLAWRLLALLVALLFLYMIFF